MSVSTREIFFNEKEFYSKLVNLRKVNKWSDTLSLALDIVPSVT